MNTNQTNPDFCEHKDTENSRRGNTAANFSNDGPDSSQWRSGSFRPLPPFHNRMPLAIFSCLLFPFGFFAIIKSFRANRLYEAALVSPDPTTRQILYLSASNFNDSAKTWIFINVIAGFIFQTGLFKLFQ